jgi:hypothetical protein
MNGYGRRPLINPVLCSYLNPKQSEKVHPSNAKLILQATRIVSVARISLREYATLTSSMLAHLPLGIIAALSQMSSPIGNIKHQRANQRYAICEEFGLRLTLSRIFDCMRQTVTFQENEAQAKTAVASYTHVPLLK